MTEGQLISKRRKDIAAWSVENFKTWPKPHELTDADPEDIGCELVVLNQHHLPVLRCKLGGGYVDSTTWFYAKRNPKKMTQTQQPEALSLAEWIESDMCCDGDAAIVAELCRQHARIEELEAAQAQRVPLSVEAIAEIAESFEATDPTDSFWVEVCRAFEGTSVSGITQEKQG